MKQLVGVVMCGGQSQRMGTDKGLIPILNTTWSAFMAAKLKNLDLPVVVSINPSQFQGYKAFFAEDELVVDAFDIGGPLNGLLSVRAKFPSHDLLLLACDMINMESATLQRLIYTHLNDAQYDFYTYESQGFAEPLCTIYTSRGLAKPGDQASSKSNSSLQKVLKMGPTYYLEIQEPASFLNYNTLPSA